MINAIFGITVRVAFSSFEDDLRLLMRHPPPRVLFLPSTRALPNN